MWNDNDLVIIERLAKLLKLHEFYFYEITLKQVPLEYFKRCSDLPTKIG